MEQLFPPISKRSINHSEELTVLLNNPPVSPGSILCYELTVFKHAKEFTDKVSEYVPFIYGHIFW